MTINYDLIKKVKKANRRFTLYHAIPEIILSGVIYYGVFIGVRTLLFKRPAMENLGMPIGFTLGHCFAKILGKKFDITRDSITNKNRNTYFELYELANQFYEELGIKTDADSLMRTELTTKKNRKITVNKDKLPVITETKYIKILTTGQEMLREEFLIQKHDLFSNKYDISKNQSNMVM